MAGSKDFEIKQGKTFNQVVRWETPPIIYRPISSIAQVAPVRIGVPAHGCVPGWRVKVASVKGMKEINDLGGQATVVDADTIEINTINAADFKPYVSGGYLVFNSPVNLTGMTARMSIKDKVGGTELLRLDTSNGRITIDETGYKIQLHISAIDTAALTWKKGVYELEMVSPDGTVTTILTGKVSVTAEVTTT